MNPTIEYSPALEVALSEAVQIAAMHKDTYVGTHHVLVAILRNESAGRRILLRLGVEPDGLAARIQLDLLT